MSALSIQFRHRIVLLGVAATAAILLFLPASGNNLVLNDRTWKVDGCFKLNSVHPVTDFDRSVPTQERRETLRWGSWCGNDASTGQIVSPAFIAPAILEVLVAGTPGRNHQSLSLQREDNHVRVPLAFDLAAWPAERWRNVRWRLPDTLRHQSVRLVAIDAGADYGSWTGISEPRTLSRLALFKQQLGSACVTVAVFLFDSLLFLLPGISFTSVFARRYPAATPIQRLMMMVIVGATVGYLAFWAFFFSKSGGRWFCYIVYLASAAVWCKTDQRRSAVQTLKTLAEPLLLTAAASICYLCFFFFLTDPLGSGAGYAGRRFFYEVRPGDNIIPLLFAERIWSREPLQPFCCGDWLSSDRPPLQTGIFLLQKPLHMLHNNALNYELLAMALQGLWVCGVWCVLTALGTSKRHLRSALAFLICSGFLFYNSVYTWPKLLASAFVLFAAAILVTIIRERRPITRLECVLGSCCLGLTLMAHPGSVFSFLAFGAAGVLCWRLLPRQRLVPALVVLPLFVLPWMAYQKFVDPPGNRLLKMHLAGEHALDSRSTWQGIRDAYRSAPVAQIWGFKLSNLKLLAGKDPLEAFGFRWFDSQEIARYEEQEWIWNAIGALNVGWLAGIAFLFRARKQTFAIPWAGWLILAGLLNFAGWSLLMFGPDATRTAHSSYADVLLVELGLISFILTLPRFIYLAVLALQIVNLVVVWIWSPHYNSAADGLSVLPLFNTPLLVIGALMLTGILFTCTFARTGQSASLEPSSAQ